MWRKSAIFGVGLVALAVGVFSEDPAQGGISRPLRIPAGFEPMFAQQQPTAPKAAVKAKRDFRQFRPVAREDLPMSAVQLSKTTIEQVYTKDFTRRMLARYQSEVQPLESRALNPYRRASRYDMERYITSRREMARWTAKEALNGQLKDFFRKGNRDSAPMQVLSAMKDLGQHDSQATPLSSEQKNARAHRLDLPPQAEEEEVIPTKLRTKLNLIYGRGQLNFVNPIVQTALNVDVSGSESFTVDMNKEFRKLTLKTRASYGVEKKRLTFNVNKKLLERVYLDLDSERHTGSSSVRDNETAKITYSLSF